MVKAIVVGKGVEGSGKLISKFSIYEFIFDKFVINVKDYNKNTWLLNITSKKNDFVEHIRSKSKHKVEKEICFELEINKNILEKFKFDDSLIFYMKGYHFAYDSNIINKFDFIFVYDNVFIFQNDEYVYILHNSKNIDQGKEANKNDDLDKIIKEIFFVSDFKFKMTDNFIVDLLK